MPGERVLELDAIVKHYRDADEIVAAVDGVTLTVDAGEAVAAYGPSGSGKTTLLLLAAGLLTPDSGRVRVLGRDLAALSGAERTRQLRRDLSFIYQSAQLMNGVPAVENAAVKLLADGVSLRRARGIAEGWLVRLGLDRRLEYTPERLSGGERQRVAIARALASDPRLILADEPTGNLDSRRGMEILSLLAELAHDAGVGVLLVTHDPQAVTVADRVIAMRDGKLTDDDSAASSPVAAQSIR
jgi:putative ABC transport system ATP-binding protein